MTTTNIYNQSGLSLNDFLVSQALNKNQNQPWQVPVQQQPINQPLSNNSLTGQKPAFGSQQPTFGTQQQTTIQQQNLQQIDPFLASNPQLQEKLLLFPKEIKTDTNNYSQILSVSQTHYCSPKPQKFHIQVIDKLFSPAKQSPVVIKDDIKTTYFDDFPMKLRFQIEAYSKNYEILELTEQFAKYK